MGIPICYGDCAAGKNAEDIVVNPERKKMVDCENVFTSNCKHSFGLNLHSLERRKALIAWPGSGISMSISLMKMVILVAMMI